MMNGLISVPADPGLNWNYLRICHWSAVANGSIYHYAGDGRKGISKSSSILDERRQVDMG
jgi:hypothetical protein